MLGPCNLQLSIKNFEMSSPYHNQSKDVDRCWSFQGTGFSILGSALQWFVTGSAFSLKIYNFIHPTLPESFIIYNIRNVTPIHLVIRLNNPML